MAVRHRDAVAALKGRTLEGHMVDRQFEKMILTVGFLSLCLS